MKIIFLSVDDEFAGNMQKFFFEKHHNLVSYSIISSTPIYKKNKISGAYFIIKKSGFYYFLSMVKIKIIRKLLFNKKQITPSVLAVKYNIPLYYTKNVNNDESLELMNRIKPDLIISTNFSHFIGRRVRNIPKFGVWNLHKSYLPYYRGMAPNFYALLNQEQNTGVTIHLIDASFDTGEILKQEKIEIHPDDTVYSLNVKTSVAGGKLLNTLFEKGDLSENKSHAQPTGNFIYYTYPTIVEIKRFRKLGNLFDLPILLLIKERFQNE